MSFLIFRLNIRIAKKGKPFRYLKLPKLPTPALPVSGSMGLFSARNIRAPLLSAAKLVIIIEMRLFYEKKLFLQSKMILSEKSFL
jgi:hypothetical protein